MLFIRTLYCDSYVIEYTANIFFEFGIVLSFDLRI